MMEDDKTLHRIRIQRVEVEFEKPDDAFKTRDLLSEVCRNRLIPAMEKLFKEKYAAGPLISIPHLLIDAGQVNAENWENDLVKSVIRRLEQYLDEKNVGRPHAERVSGDVEVTSGDTRAGDGGKEEHKRAALFVLSYLEKGLQPWNSPYQRKEQLRNELQRLLMSSRRTLDRQTFRDRLAGGRQAAGGGRDEEAGRFRDDFFRDLMELLAGNLNAVKRLLYLLPEKGMHLISVKKGWDRAKLKKMRKKWNVIFGLSGLPENERDPVFLQALSILHGKQKPPVFSEALSQEIVRVLERWHKPVFMNLPEVLEKYLILIPGKNLRDHRNEPLHFPSPETSASPLTEEPVYIANAGLVLLHPFLHYLFENAGHTVKNNWGSAELQQRSIILSQYLVTEQDDYTEHDLFLNKLLAGFPLEAPLPLDIALSNFEKNEARELLESVIAHWKALKNTSIPALRETFLQRPGKITPRENGWLLEVDQQVPDVLLGKIPWGFSTIKTTWMKEILNVEWA